MNPNQEECGGRTKRGSWTIKHNGNTKHVFHNLFPAHRHGYRWITKPNGRSSSEHHILAYFSECMYHCLSRRPRKLLSHNLSDFYGEEIKKKLPKNTLNFADPNEPIKSHRKHKSTYQSIFARAYWSISLLAKRYFNGNCLSEDCQE